MVLLLSWRMRWAIALAFAILTTMIVPSAVVEPLPMKARAQLEPTLYPALLQLQC